MYERHWRLSEKPFENTADPKYIYYSLQHEEAFSRLSYCIDEQKGAGLLTGVFGCGKTLIAQAITEKLNPGRYEVAFIINPKLSEAELLREIVYCLGIKENLPTLKTDILHILNERLHNNRDNGKDTVVIIDEAHIITDKLIFEELRLLLNFQYKNKFLLTLLLLGQPELKDKIGNIKQLEQRIAVKYHLTNLNQEETCRYINHRLKIAGAQKDIFDKQAIKLIYNVSGGIPRRINQVCDLALLAGFGKGADKITSGIIEEVSKDIEGD